MNEEVKVVRKIGIFRGIGMMWTSFVVMVVEFFEAGADVGKTVHEATGVMKKHVENWSTESQLEFEAELEKRKQEMKAEAKQLESKVVTQ